MKATAVSFNMQRSPRHALDHAVIAFEDNLAGLMREPEAAQPTRMTSRQREVLSLLCEGLPNKLIARQLNISAATVKAHIGRILRELGVASRLQAVVMARRRGLVGAPRCNSTFTGEAGLLRSMDEMARRTAATVQR